MTEREAALVGFARRFVNRWDWYALQRSDGSYVAVHKPLTLGLVRRHLAGTLTLGVYALDEQSRARWACFDADDGERWRSLIGLHERLGAQRVPSYLEQSRRGGHLWLFFGEPLAGRSVRLFARALLADAVELFPKQDQVAPGRPGSLVRLPLGVHRKDMQRYRLGLEVGGGRPPHEQLQLLANAATVPSAYVADALAAQALATPAKPPFRVAQEASRAVQVREGLIARIKREIDLYALVARHVELTSSGRGHCPFHDDAHMSFSVNREVGYFNCFAGCGGGDVITFWERYRGISTTQAVRELAALLPGPPEPTARS